MVERKTFSNVPWIWLYRTTSRHPSCSLVTQKCILWAHPDTAVPWNMQFPLPGMLGIFSSIPLGNLSPSIRLISDRWCLSSTASLPWCCLGSSGLSGGTFQLPSMAVWLRSVPLLQAATGACMRLMCWVGSVEGHSQCAQHKLSLVQGLTEFKGRSHR